MTTLLSKTPTNVRRTTHLALLIALHLAAAHFTSALRADDADSMSVGYAESSPGDSSALIVTGRNSQAIHGYSIAISFPADTLEVLAIGIDGTNVSILEPGFVGSRIDNDLGIATLGVIFNYGEASDVTALDPTPVDQPDRILARLQFAVKSGARGGNYPIELVDGLGAPSTFNRFTTAGRSTSPELHSGIFRVASKDVLAIEKKVAFAGATPNLPMFTYALHESPLSGYSLAVLFDCGESVLTLLEASLDQTTVATELGRLNQVEFFQTDVDDTLPDDMCRSRTGVIFDYVPPFNGQSLSPSTSNLFAQSILRLRFSVGPNARAEREYQDLVLDNRPEPGALNNVILVGSDSLDPERIHGKIYFSTGSVTGVIRDIATGEPIQGASVVTRPEGYEAFTDADGVFELDEVIPGRYEIVVEKNGYYRGFFSGFEATGKNRVDDWGSSRVYRVPPSGGVFRRGFVNIDQKADISDSVWLLNWLFKGGPPPECLLAADINADNRNDISDSIYLLSYLFGGGPRPPDPFETCGSDPDSTLGCEFISSCP
jgi:hypothetical protein